MTVIVKSPRECPEVFTCWLFKSLVRVVTTEADVERVLCLSNMLFSAHPAFDQIVKLFVFVVAEALVQNTLPVTVLVKVIRI